MNITVLAGGISPERDVSLKSGEMVARALEQNGHHVVLLDIYVGIQLPEGGINKLFNTSLENAGLLSYFINEDAPDLESIIAAKPDKSVYFGENVIDICRASDIVFMALHGADGENGKVQAAFDLFGIKYTGAESLSCALAMDKSVAKMLFKQVGIPVVDGFVVKRSQKEIKEPETGFPCVVKPLSGGSSVGVTIAYSMDEYEKGLKEAFKWEGSVLVERFIKGRELSVGVISGEALPVIEIAPVEGFYDYKNKYTSGKAVETCPADIPEDATKVLQKYAVNASKVLNINTYSRMDFILEDNTGDIYCLEANTLPGMTSMSLIPQEAAQIGVSYNELCEKIIKISMEKYE